MGTQLEILELEALKLTPIERAALVQRLLASLDRSTAIDDEWAAEIERRVADVENGASQGIPVTEALTKIRAAMK